MSAIDVGSRPGEVPSSLGRSPLLEIEDLRISITSDGSSFEVVKGVALTVCAVSYTHLTLPTTPYV